MRQKRVWKQIKKSEVKKYIQVGEFWADRIRNTASLVRKEELSVSKQPSRRAYRHGPASPRNGKTERLREIRRDSAELSAIREHPLAWSRHASTVHLHSPCDQSRTPHGFTELVSDLSSSPPLFLFPPSSPFQKCRRNCQDMQLHLSGVERRGAWAKY